MYNFLHFFLKQNPEQFKLGNTVAAICIRLTLLLKGKILFAYCVHVYILSNFWLGANLLLLGAEGEERSWAGSHLLAEDD